MTPAEQAAAALEILANLRGAAEALERAAELVADLNFPHSREAVAILRSHANLIRIAVDRFDGILLH